ncbi:MAG: NUDIX domain-containing protein [Bacteroidota bacterium]|nr:NUDIX domain-containing protein [Bacteroidota bacterium]
MPVNKFTIRVYGILINEYHEVLLVHEKMPQLHFTKFPGGGLEFGEGLRECLAREFKEETGIDVEIGEHLYTTDFFQPSIFRPTDQLLAVYYKVNPVSIPVIIDLEEKEITMGNRTENLRFFWSKIENFDIEQLTFPVDKIVAQKFLH